MAFNVEEARKKWELTDLEFEANMDEFFSELALCSKRTLEPNFIFVGGQAGAGKSTLVAKEYQNLEGNAIIIDQDELRTKFPTDKYKEIHDECTEREEYLLLKPYVNKCILAIVERAEKDGYNIILESSMSSVRDFFIDIIKELRQKGYRTKLSVLTVPEVEGNISMLTRYCYYLERDGECRRNTRIDSSAVQNIRTNIQRFDALGIFDNISISVRGKDIDSLPVQKYSKKINTGTTPEAYDKEKRAAFEGTRRNFYIRYEQIERVLREHNEIEQLKKLEDIRGAFERQLEMRE